MPLRLIGGFVVAAVIILGIRWLITNVKLENSNTKRKRK